MSTSSDTRGGSISLDESVLEARTLMRFASRNGIALDDATVATVIATGVAQTEGSLTPAQETAFWPALRALAHAVAPVTIDSIRATVDDVSSPSTVSVSRIRRRPLSIARWYARKYRCYAVLTLFVVIALQVYWVVGVSIVKDTVALEADVAAVDAQIVQRTEAEELNAVSSVASDASAPAKKAVAGKAATEKADLQKEPSEKGSTENLATTEQLEERQSSLQEWLKQNYTTLKTWNGYWAWFVALGTGGSSEAHGSVGKNRGELVSAGFALLALSNYVLPLLYGFLGACAFVLRELSTKIRDVTFAPGDRTRQSLRLALGPLAGIAVGLFLAPDVVSTHAGSLALLEFAQPAAMVEVPRPHLDAIGINTLGPLALAFLAGYSVELLFAVMDRILGAFTEDPSHPLAGTQDRKKL